MPCGLLILIANVAINWPLNKNKNYYDGKN